MTPGAIIALVKDVVIVIAVAFVIYIFISYGKDIVKVNDMKAVQAQLQRNTEITAKWQKEQTDANSQRDADLAKVKAAIDKQRAPVYIVRGGPANPGAVPATPTQAACPVAGTWGTDPGPGVDSRPAINAFELKYETAIADCRAALVH